MDLLKLVAELREYRAQIAEAIAAMEELARRRHPNSAAVKIVEEKPVKKPAVPVPVKKKKRKTAKKKSG